MTDVYGRSGQDFGGAVSADAAKIVFAAPDLGGGGVGMLVQQLGLNYQQQVTRVFEVGSDKTFYIVGRTQGQVSMSRILGPRPVQLGFYTKFGNACNASTNNINFVADTGCNNSSGSTSFTNGTYAFTIKFAIIIQLGITVQAQDMVINEQVGMMFAALNAGQNQ
jgi:hypothetical protein